MEKDYTFGRFHFVKVKIFVKNNFRMKTKFRKQRNRAIEINEKKSICNLIEITTFIPNLNVKNSV